MKRFGLVWLLLGLLVPLSATFGAGDPVAHIPPGEKRVALVVGNNAYAHVGKLETAVTDAQAMRRELTGLGFDVVFRQDATRREMNKALSEFTLKLSADSVGLMFYAGHGVQIKGANYLVPVDIEIQEESDMVNDGIDVARVLEQMGETRAKFSLVILDACRDNPFKGRGTRGIGGTRGLAAPTSSASGVMVVYSAGANQKALDRLSDEDTNPNGLFTREFLKAIKEPGVSVKMAVENVKQTVIAQAQSVGHIQTPAIYDQSTGSFSFTLPPTTKTVASSANTGGGQVDRESIFWQETHGDPGLCQDYLRQWPNGVYAAIAKRCADRNNAVAATRDVVGNKLEPIDREVKISEKGGVRLREKADAKSKSIRMLKEGETVHVLGRVPDGKWYQVEVTSGKDVKEGYIVASALGTLETVSPGRDAAPDRKVWTDPLLAMEFAWVPGGKFEMGCEDWTSDCYDNERPVHAVTLGGFWLGKTEVTQGQWKAVIGTNPSSFKECGDDCPVEQVSWQDVQEFIKKLNVHGDGKYRLPTEAEWEYACRSGGKPEKYAGGNELEPLAWSEQNSDKRTRRVGTKTANGLGLLDMSGNVWEWVQDWRGTYNNVAQTDPQGDQSGTLRVTRGGSWSSYASYVRCSIRDSVTPLGRHNYLGVRIARSP